MKRHLADGPGLRPGRATTFPLDYAMTERMVRKVLSTQRSER